MSAAELLLRLGCSLVAWLVLFAHALWLVVLGAMGCTGEGAQPWLALLWWTPLTLLFAALLPAGFSVPGIAGALRMPVIGLLPLLAFSARTPLRVLDAVNVAGQPLCGASAQWTMAWAPIQLLVIIVLVAIAIALWRRGGRGVVSTQTR